jgi:hypothetical protein
MIRSAILSLALIAAPLSAAPLVNEYNARLLKLSSLQQRAVLRRAILDDGGQCGRVTAVAWRGPYTNLQRWEAVCDRGGSYAVFIGLDSSVQVRDCPSLASLRLPVCRPVAPLR